MARRRHSELTRAFLRALAFVVTVAIWPSHPVQALRVAEAPELAVDSAASSIDAVVPGARATLSVAQAPVLKRLPAVPFDVPIGRAPASPWVRVLARKVTGQTLGFEHARVRRHIPRMDSGDPPRA